MDNGNETTLRGKVLVADDLFFMRVLLRTILTEAGHTVVAEASTGREAVSLYNLFRPDVVMMDISMPERDGLTAMEEIIRINPSAQVVVCTALAFRKVATEALLRGACDFIIKPFRPETILLAVQGALRRLQSPGYAGRNVVLHPAVLTGGAAAMAVSGNEGERIARRPSLLRRNS